MKRVRFLTPLKMENLATLNESDCHSPRPFIHRDIDGVTPELPCDIANQIVYSPDPVRRFECSDSSPYPIVKKTNLPATTREVDVQFSPCNDLELSMLDASSQLPRKPVYFTPLGNLPTNQENALRPANIQHLNVTPESPINILTSIENTKAVTPPNMLSRGDNFFITRGNLNRFQLQGSLQVQMNKLSVGKENDTNVLHAHVNRVPRATRCLNAYNLDNSSCGCHHCIKVEGHNNFNTSTPGMLCEQKPVFGEIHFQNSIKQPPNQPSCNHCTCTQQTKQTTPQSCHIEALTPKQQNTVDKKAWVLEKYEQAKNKCTDVEKQMNIKERREPTVGDLLKIIKLQNEQLQLLQEKVDKLISTNSTPITPRQNYVTEQVAVETIDRDQHKISIGVMTSLEMVRTSTIINKEHIVKQTYDNAQIQCNRSEISIKEVVKQPVNLNFLDGILPVGKTASLQSNQRDNQSAVHMSNCNEKTFNEMSLCNVQVDNATTPLMSPEQSLYLDVRDYSGSDTSSDQSNVGWTYYNKVMTHVNGMLQDSDMPSSASALYRNTRQQCLQMQIDKTNISVTKRVTFGDEPPLAHQHLTTDTSLRMNQLAAKYLKAPASASPPARQPDLSFATRNYMERHKLIQGQNNSSRRAAPDEMPRFLDITTLKQQPKLL